MHPFKKAALIVIALLIFFGVVIFILENQQTASLTFLGWQSPPLSIALFFVGALLIGLAIGPLLGMLMYWRKRASLKRELRSS